MLLFSLGCRLPLLITERWRAPIWSAAARRRFDVSVLTGIFAYALQWPVFKPVNYSSSRNARISPR
jgi:hypothetical protein